MTKSSHTKMDLRYDATITKPFFLAVVYTEVYFNSVLVFQWKIETQNRKTHVPPCYYVV